MGETYTENSLRNWLDYDWDIRTLWVIRTITFPIRRNNSTQDEIITDEILLAEFGEGMFTSANQKKFSEFMEAAVVGYKQHWFSRLNGAVYPITPYQKECIKLYCNNRNCIDQIIAKKQIIFLGKIICYIGEQLQEIYWDKHNGGMPHTWHFSIPIISEDEDSVEENPDNIVTQDAGDVGESKVDYVLRWCEQEGFFNLKKDCCSRYKKNCILLKNSDFMDEPQEFDHIVVCSAGIINIETKNYAGKITITQSGDWIQTKDEQSRGVENPVFQVDRHHALLSSIVGEIPIYDIICIANTAAIIEGAEYSPIPVLKHDRLQRYMAQFRSGNSILAEEQIPSVIAKIEKYKVNRHDIGMTNCGAQMVPDRI